MITLLVYTRFNKPVKIKYKSLTEFKNDLKDLYKYTELLNKNKYILDIYKIPSKIYKNRRNKYERI